MDARILQMVFLIAAVMLFLTAYYMINSYIVSFQQGAGGFAAAGGLSLIAAAIVSVRNKTD